MCSFHPNWARRHNMHTLTSLPPTLKSVHKHINTVLPTDFFPVILRTHDLNYTVLVICIRYYTIRWRFGDINVRLGCIKLKSFGTLCC